MPALLVTALMLVLAALAIAFFGENPGGIARLTGLAGLGLAAGCASTYAIRLYRAGATASLPASVARVHVPVRPARAFNVAAVGAAFGLPLALVTVALTLVTWAWMPVAGVLVVGVVAVGSALGEAGRRPYAVPAPAAEEMLRRLCMRGNMRAPELVVENDAMANCWTAGGRIYMTTPLVRLLDDSEVEAVLAHELAHIAHRDAAVMEICSAPSRVLLGFASYFTRNLPRLLKELLKSGAGGLMCATLALALCIPPAFVLGWVSRLSVLGMSRAREFSADAAAATLTGSPSALASALMKLEGQTEWAPPMDLRQQAHAVLCIVGTGRSPLGRAFRTHPSTAARVKRLGETEARIQAASHPARL